MSTLRQRFQKAELDELRAENERALERCAEMVIKAGLATGHADTVESLMAEVLAQVAELRAENERLREVVRDAPHDRRCAGNLVEMYDSGYCDCWKAEALK